MGPEIFGYMRFSYLGRSDAKLARGTDDAPPAWYLHGRFG